MWTLVRLLSIYYPVSCKLLLHVCFSLTFYIAQTITRGPILDPTISFIRFFLLVSQKWEMFRNLVDLAVKLRFYELYTYG